MRQYEAVYIIDPTLEEEQLAALVERFQSLVGNQGGEVQHVDRWERRRLAFEIKGRREGFYVVMNFRGISATETELSRVLGITDGVLRHMIVRMDDRKAEKAIADAKAAAAVKARTAAEAQATAQAAAAQAAAEAAAAPPPAPAAPPRAPAAPAPAPMAAAEAAPASSEEEETGTDEATTGTEA